ncbi:MobA/MobL family protein, partial [Christensenellaceae bacterium OttesenSCG-928-K19]|nr:MobA/MobL family protein [Christensenellaceae bacterium OttesenSCG-928-K19]
MKYRLVPISAGMAPGAGHFGKGKSVAIYHCTVKIINRKSGRSSVGAAAYRSCERIRNEQDGRVHNYLNKSGAAHKEIMLPDNAPAQFRDRALLWNAVELVEKRKDAQTAREVEVALPVELDAGERVEVLRKYVSKNFVSQGMIADITIHDKLDGNPHAHIMLTTREVDIQGFGKKERAWNDKELLAGWRESWAAVCNERLEKHAARIDHRTLAAQGIDRVPQIHIGANATAAARKDMAAHEGRTLVSRYTDNRMIKEYNRGGIDKRDFTLFITDAWRLPKVENIIARLERGRPADLRPTEEKTQEPKIPAAHPAMSADDILDADYADAMERGVDYAGNERQQQTEPHRYIDADMDDLEPKVEKQSASDRAKLEELTKRKQDIVAARSEIYQKQHSLAEHKRSLDNLGWGYRRVKKNLKESIAKT